MGSHHIGLLEKNTYSMGKHSHLARNRFTLDSAFACHLPPGFFFSSFSTLPIHHTGICIHICVHSPCVHVRNISCNDHVRFSRRHFKPLSVLALVYIFQYLIFVEKQATFLKHFYAFLQTLDMQQHN